MDVPTEIAPWSSSPPRPWALRRTNHEGCNTKSARRLARMSFARTMPDPPSKHRNIDSLFVNIYILTQTTVNRSLLTKQVDCPNSQACPQAERPRSLAAAPPQPARGPRG